MTLYRTVWLLPLLAGLLLTACAKPTTLGPKVSADEIAAERDRQVEIAHGDVEVDYGNFSYGRGKLLEFQQRLQRIADKLSPAATKLCREVKGPDANCNMHIELSPAGKGINAHADGQKIVVYPAMVDFAKSDTHLAFVLAHEYTHHFMRHVQSQQGNVLVGALLGTAADAVAASQGMQTQGQFGKLGAQASILAYSPSFETEADYIALYMLARAQYPYESAPNFWREMAKNNPRGIYNRTTHPTTPERFVGMTKTIEEIKAKQKAGTPLLPNMQPTKN